MLPLRHALLVIGLGIGLLALAACGGSPTPTSAPLPTVEVTVTSSSGDAETATEEVTEVATVEMTAEATDVALLTADCTRLDLNNLTEDQLMATIPDFSSRMVREFFEYRPYVSIQQFRREIGKYVDEAQVAEYEQYVYVPIDPNEVDADTLMQIDGVDEALANTLIAGRPYATNQAFLDALAGSLDAAQLAQAACYLTPES
jgi:radical SAM superfamily enzyme with C-terminal helix-hairpin-helix motif